MANGPEVPPQTKTMMIKSPSLIVFWPIHMQQTPYKKCALMKVDNIFFQILKKRENFLRLKLQESDHNAFIRNFKLKRPIGSSSTRKSLDIKCLFVCAAIITSKYINVVKLNMA